MRSKLLIIAVLSLILSLSSSFARLVNGSFEEQGEQEDRAVGWNRWGDWINRETGWTPTRDGKCIIGYHHWQIEKGDTSGLWQNVPNIEAGKKYVFTVYANVDRADEESANPKEVELRLETKVNGKQSTVASKKFKFSDLAEGENWSQLQVSATAPNDKLRVLIIVTPASGHDRGGAIKFDEASLVSE